MNKNEIIKEYFEKEYGKQKNYEAIMKKIKGGKSMKKKVINTAAIFVMIVTIGFVTQTIYANIAWNIEYKKYQNRDVITRNIAMEEAQKEGQLENLSMEYLVQDEIAIKVQSLMMTNDYVEIRLDMKQPKTPEKISYGYAIYDENNNIYAFSQRMSKVNKKNNVWKKLKQELGIPSNLNNVLSDLGSNSSSGIEMRSSTGFPHSKKLYIRIFDIGYDILEKSGKVRNVCLSDSEWQFEIDVPKKIYERTEIELMLSQEIEGITLNKAQLSETGLSIKVNLKDLRNFLMSGKDMDTKEFDKLRDAAFYLSDGEDNIYMATDMGTTKNENEIQAKFGIGKQDLDKKIYLNVSLNDVQAKIQLVEK